VLAASFLGVLDLLDPKLDLLFERLFHPRAVFAAFDARSRAQPTGVPPRIRLDMHIIRAEDLPPMADLLHSSPSATPLATAAPVKGGRKFALWHLLLVLLAFSPVSTLALAWLLGLGFLITRSILEGVEAAGGFRFETSFGGLWCFVVVVSLAHAAWLNRSRPPAKVRTRLQRVLRFFAKWALIAGLTMFALGTVVIEREQVTDVSPELQRFAMVLNYWLWGFLATQLVFRLAHAAAATLARILNGQVRTRALVLSACFIPGLLLVALRIAPPETTANAGRLAWALLKATDDLLAVVGDPQKRAAPNAGFSFGEQASAPFFGPSYGEPYTVPECFEALATPGLPAGSRLFDSARCGARAMSPIESVWCQEKRRYSGREEELADAIGEAIIQTCVAQPKSRGERERDLAGYLSRATKNKLISGWRREQTRSRHGWPGAVYGATPIDNELDESNCTAMLRKAIAALPERERELIHQHYFENTSYVELAARGYGRADTLRKQVERRLKEIRPALELVCRR
jgi:RNA polymerase sigma factor (sigma-70 family)